MTTVYLTSLLRMKTVILFIIPLRHLTVRNSQADTAIQTKQSATTALFLLQKNVSRWRTRTAILFTETTVNLFILQKRVKPQRPPRQEYRLQTRTATLFTETTVRLFIQLRKALQARWQRKVAVRLKSRLIKKSARNHQRVKCIIFQQTMHKR